jgi:hypothetical protein
LRGRDRGRRLRRRRISGLCGGALLAILLQRLLQLLLLLRRELSERHRSGDVFASAITAVQLRAVEQCAERGGQTDAEHRGEDAADHRLVLFAHREQPWRWPTAQHALAVLCDDQVVRLTELAHGERNRSDQCRSFAGKSQHALVCAAARDRLSMAARTHNRRACIARRDDQTAAARDVELNRDVDTE